MKLAVRAVVIDSGEILLIYRNKFGREYYTLPGGHVEMNEDPVAAVIREIKEETSMKLENPRLIFTEESPAPYGRQLIYEGKVAEKKTPKLAEDADETKITALGKNIYKPVWYSLAGFKNLPFLSGELKQRIISGIERGYFSDAETFSSEAEISYNS